MKLLDSKKAIEQYIANNYNETEIHWAGMKFNTEGKNEWVHFQYVADIVSDCGFSNDKYSQQGSLQVSIVSKNPFRCNEIADVVLDMFKGVKIDKLFTGKVRILTTDYVEEIDKSIMEIEILLTTM